MVVRGILQIAVNISGCVSYFYSKSDYKSKYTTTFVNLVVLERSGTEYFVSLMHLGTE